MKYAITNWTISFDLFVTINYISCCVPFFIKKTKNKIIIIITINRSAKTSNSLAILPNVIGGTSGYPPITVFGTRDAAFEVWSREDGTPFPALSEQIELDPDDLCPEGGVTKQLWKNHYEGIEQWREEFAKGVLPFGSRQSFINKIVSIISVKISYGI